MDANKLIDTYVKLRDKKKSMQDDFKAQLEPVEEGLMKVESKLMQMMQDVGVDKLAGAAGTAFVKVNVSMTVADWDEVIGYVKENDAYDLLEKRVSKTAAQERGDVPGLAISQTRVVQIRRK